MDTYIDIIKSLWQSLSQIWWIVFPVAFYYVFIPLWEDFVQDKWLGSLNWTLIEVIPPKDLEKSPKPMESVFVALTGVVVTFNCFDEYLIGKLTDRFSFELVSLGGEVHYYIRVQKKLRNLVESQIYAQYPGAEIFEVEDYMDKFPKVAPNKDWEVWGADMELTQADPFPIRTYDKFEEDISGTMIDPMAGFLELFASVPPGQNLLLQLVINPLPEVWKKEQVKHVQKLALRETGEKKSFLEDIMDIIKNIIPGIFSPVEFTAAKKADQPLAFRLTPHESERLKALEENLGKNFYRVKMRFLNVGKKEGFDGSMQTAFFGVLRQFNDLNSNNLKPSNSKPSTSFVAVDLRAQIMKRRLFDRYRRRNMDGDKIHLSTTELATIYHFPDMGVLTPAIPRVESKKGTPPFNLPIE
ncbi:MAG: hypothetical protein ACD_15C00004G0002 [uncultured bacterium]|nr:MAG: hypothetical protein ACD_15C00004G0002 [uncultured bacterium]HCU70729.1 hypothetical protein [Candidatus Moranbacteria bacterium]